MCVCVCKYLPGLRPSSWTRLGLQVQNLWLNLVMRVSKYSPLSSGAWMCLKNSRRALGRNWLLKLWRVTNSSRTSRLHKDKYKLNGMIETKSFSILTQEMKLPNNLKCGILTKIKMAPVNMFSIVTLNKHNLLYIHSKII